MLTLQPEDRLPSEHLPPAYFKEARNVQNVRQVPYTPKPENPSVAQKAGLKYEAAFHTVAAALWGDTYRTFTRTQFSFMDTNGWRTCRPDGILALDDCWYLFEVKIRHTADAWWQLHRLYIPMLKALGITKPIIPVEVCRSFDPMVDFPGSSRPILLSQLPLEEPAGAETLILTWRP